ncbi:MAG: hypothetical protein MI757_04330 [Pirellulales bacterium]|nr:hypothetical protein [Pirellulales bacterium]
MIMPDRIGDREPLAADSPQRVILLGASNVTRSIRVIYETLEEQFAQPLEFLSAHGHGRSYGLETSVLGRRLPSIRDCGLWKAIEDRESRRAKVLVTDIGNDLIYGQTAETLMDWVRDCLDRVQAMDAEVVVTQLPVANFDRITPRTYRVMKTIFFPSCRVDLPKILARAEKVSELLKAEVASRKIGFVEPLRTWYGWDPVHIKRRYWRDAWRDILQFSHRQTAGETRRGLSFWQKVRLKFYAPQRRVVLGFSQRKTQPVARFSDGSTVSYF